MHQITAQEHNKRLTLHSKGYQDGEIAKIVKVSRSTIQSWRNHYHIPANRPPQNSGKHRRPFIQSQQDAMKRRKYLWKPCQHPNGMNCLFIHTPSSKCVRVTGECKYTPFQDITVTRMKEQIIREMENN